MKSFVIILLIIVSKSLGDVCLSHGMREVGEMNLLHHLSMFATGLQILVNPWIELATMSLLTYSVSSLLALSWLDLSYILPLSAFNYVLTSLFAWQLLHEEIATTRWLGILVIASGVLFISLSDCKAVPLGDGTKSQPQALKSSLGHISIDRDED